MTALPYPYRTDSGCGGLPWPASAFTGRFSTLSSSPASRNSRKRGGKIFRHKSPRLLQGPILQHAIELQILGEKTPTCPLATCDQTTRLVFASSILRSPAFPPGFQTWWFGRNSRSAENLHDLPGQEQVGTGRRTHNLRPCPRGRIPGEDSWRKFDFKNSAHR